MASLSHFTYMDFCPQADRLRSVIHGLSHGQKTCPRHVFLTAFRVLFRTKKRGRHLASAFLVREMGLEPTRRNHTHLKRACLPIQHSRKQLEYYNLPVSICQYFFCKTLERERPVW